MNVIGVSMTDIVVDGVAECKSRKMTGTLSPNPSSSVFIRGCF